MVADKQIVTSVDMIILYLLSKDSMTPKKLQKMLYYCYGWTLALLNESGEDLDIELFDDEFEAWVHGPVLKDVYHTYKTYGYNEIPKQNVDITALGIEEEVLEILEEVWEVYGSYSGNELESISHQEKPWIEARVGLEQFEATNNKISKTTVFEYFNSISG